MISFELHNGALTLSVPFAFDKSIDRDLSNLVRTP